MKLAVTSRASVAQIVGWTAGCMWLTSMNALVPLRAMVPKFCINSALVIPASTHEQHNTIDNQRTSERHDWLVSQHTSYEYSDQCLCP